MKQKILSIFTVLVMLLTSACTTDQRILSLEAVITSLEVLLPVLEVANPQNAAIYTMIDDSLVGIPSALEQTKTELASLDSDAIKAGKIALYFAPVVASLNLLPPEAQLITMGVMKAIQAFLTSISLYDKNFALKPKYKGGGATKPYFLPKGYQVKIQGIEERIGKLAKK